MPVVFSARYLLAIGTVSGCLALTGCGGGTTPPADAGPPEVDAGDAGPPCTSDAECDDGNACTDDACGGGTCAHTPAAAGSACGAEGDVCDGAGACVACVDDVDGAGRDSGCSVAAPICSAGACVACTADADCGGGMTCVGGACEGCSASSDCDDGLSCTDDACDVATSRCVHETFDARCEDGLFCNGAEACAPSDERANADGCLAGPPPARADGVACTVDTCEEATDTLLHTPNDGACDDGNECTVDACDAALGCVAPPAADGALCDGGAGVCGAGVCLDCVDSDTGNGTDQGCGGGAPFCVAGSCVGCLATADCGPNQTCTDGVCVGCTGHSDCDDGVACTTDACDPVTTICVFAPSDTACDDGAFCNGAERCAPASVAADGLGCAPGAAPVVDDGVDCTADRCDEGARRVLHTPDDGACDDGEDCTRDECRLRSGCASTLRAPGSACDGGEGVCDDAGACGVCVDDRASGIDSGCSAEAPSCSAGTCIVCATESAACPLDCEGTPGGPAVADACGVCDADPDNNCLPPCDVASCAECDGTDPAACDDLNECTADSCVAGRCVHDAAPRDGAACVDSDVCTVTSTCAGGACTADRRLACDRPCHTGVCDPVSGCVLAATGSACDDGVAGTAGDRCLDTGVCYGVCNDGNPCTFDITRFGAEGNSCLPPAVFPGVSCDRDADPCTAPVCDATGACVPQVAPSCVDCATATCEGQCLTGACTTGEGCEPVATGTACDDGDPNSIGDACDGGGRCLGECAPRECGFWIRTSGGQCVGASFSDSECPEPADPCMRATCSVEGRCEVAPRASGDRCTHPCGGGSCSATGVCELTEDFCGTDQNLCWRSACDLATNTCARMSDDPGCLFDTSVCDPRTRTCDAGVCGDLMCDANCGYLLTCAPSDEELNCPQDCLGPCEFEEERSCTWWWSWGTPRAGAWRAHQSSAYGWPYSGTHQTESLSQMLTDGLRWLHLVIDYCTPGASSGPLCLCAGDDTCAAASIPLEPRLGEIHAWMLANPSEVVALLLWEYVGDADLRAAFERTGAADMLYRRTSFTGYEQFEMDINDMAAKNRRLVVFGGGFLPLSNILLGNQLKWDPSDGPPPNLASPFTSRDGTHWECADAENRTPRDVPGFDGLYVLVHTTDLATWSGAACFNQYAMDHHDGCRSEGSRGGGRPADAMFFDFYNASSDAIAYAGGVSPYADRCLDEVQACLTDGECDSGSCGGLFICVTCESNADCAESQYCDTYFGSCLTDQADGALCLSDEVCQSGNCDVVCQSCASHADCEEGEWCDAFGGCQPAKARGFGCVTDVECISGACYAAFCAECNDQSDCPSTEFCNLDILPGASMCVARTATGGPCVNDFECATGNCHAAVCSECDEHADCASTEFCTLDVVPPIESTCEPKKANGSSCGSAVECTSAQCTLFTCGECVSDADCPASENCNALNECAPDVGNNAPCLRSSQCTTAICSAGFCAECTSDSHCPASENCDAGGDCAPDVGNNAPCLRSSQCTTGICSAGFCAECLSDANCSTNENCDAGGDCAPDVGNNMPCLRDSQCTTGICSAGFCAECLSDSDCSASENCDAGGDCAADVGNNAPCLRSSQCTTGICSAGFCAECTSDSHCPASENCDAGGDCAPDVGNNAPCLRNAQCTTGICSAGLCAECTTHSHCGSTGWCDVGGDCQARVPNGTACSSNVVCLSGCCGITFVCGGLGC